MSEYTPTTEWIRIMVGYAKTTATDRELPIEEARAEGYEWFDRWLAAHDREVAAKALTDTADDLESRGYESFDRLTVGNVLSKLRARADSLRFRSRRRTAR